MPEGPEIRRAADQIERVLKGHVAQDVQFGLPPLKQRTLSFEIGLQNGTAALLVTATILKIPETTIAPMFYSILMFVFAGLALLIFKRMGTPAARDATG